MIEVNLNKDRKYGLDIINRSYHKLLIQRDGIEVEISVRVDHALKTIEVVESKK